MRYEIVHTLFENEDQSVYFVKDTLEKDFGSPLMTEIRNGNIIYAIKDMFSIEKIGAIPNVTSAFYENLKFYIVSEMSDGDDIETFLKKNTIRMADKLQICSELLHKLSDLSMLPPLLIYSFCDYNNILVFGKYHISFNSLFIFDKNKLNISIDDVIFKIGNILWSIFSNSIHESESKYDDDIPPAILSIMAKCANAQYKSIYDILKDFKSTLLYTTFMGSASIDEEILSKFKKAKRKNGFNTFLKYSLLTFASASVIFFGAQQYLKLNKTHDMKPSNSPASAIKSKAENKVEKPKAKFAPNIEKIYAGQKVSFLDYSYGNSSGSNINNHSWTLSKDDEILSSSDSSIFDYNFSEPGIYRLELVVMDSQGNKSDSYSSLLEVFPKQEAGQNNSDGSKVADFK